MAAELITLPFRPVINTRGVLEPGALLDVFLTGTTTRITVYSDGDMSVALPNPVVADSAGVFPSVYWDNAQTVRVRVRQANGTVLGDDDPYLASNIAEVSIPLSVRPQTGTTYTLVAADANAVITATNASAITLTLPSNATAAIPVGSFVEFVQGGAGQITFVAGSGATLLTRGSLVTTAGQNAIAAVRKTATNTFVLTGDLA